MVRLGPFKGINKDNKDFFPNFSDFLSKFWSLNFGFPLVLGGFGGYRRLREACRKHFHQMAPLLALGITSYDRKTKKVNEYLINEYLSLSV